MTQHSIGEPATLNTNDLNLFHNNPRTGNVEAIRESIEENGIYKPLVVNKGTHTGRPNEVLAGNHSLKAVQAIAADNPDDEQWQKVDVWLVDVDDTAATKIVLADNKTADHGEYDDQALYELLSAIDENLDGTGYNYDDLEDLSALMEEVDTQEETPAAPAPEGGTVEPTPQSKNEASNLYEAKGQDHAAPGYADSPTRMMILHYPLNQFVWVNERLAELHDAHPEWDGANAAAIISILEAETGQKAPKDDTEQE